MKPSIPKGTRDFSPEQMLKRNFLFSVMRECFQAFGYDPIETPSFEKSETLMGKYGDEGDRLIFKILNSGDYLAKADELALTNRDSKALTKNISERALRYDLTVPFARYVVQHRNDITFPFKRSQIQPVWRADRPQKGRFREFFQCDADIVGSDSLWSEVELVQLYDTVFTKLGLKTAIRINNRKILSGLAEVSGVEDKLIDFTVALDKLDKIGKDGVTKEMLEKDISQEAIDIISPLLDFEGDNQDKLNVLKSMFTNSEIGQKGVEELEFILNSTDKLGLGSATLEVDLTLARGLNYYTGAIFEVISKEVKLGSIGGGGRYDNLTEIFGLKDVSGVGISFGLDRIYLVLEELDRFPKMNKTSTEVLFINFGEMEALFCQKVLKDLRLAGISSELYPDAAKMKKQMGYADKKEIPWVILVGENEMNSNEVKLKNMQSGDQVTLSTNELIDHLKGN